MVRLRHFVAVGLLSLFSFVLLFSGLTKHASGQDTGWFSGTPSVQQVGNVTTAQRLARPKCNNMTLKVNRQIWNGNFGVVSEDHCMVQTTNGLMDSNGQILQPVGFNTAFPIQNNADGVAVLVPVPNQAAVLSLDSDASFPGLDVSLYYNFYDNLKLNVLTNTFELNKQPDFRLKYASGRVLPLNISGSLAFSDDGRYFAADVPNGGFVRVDLDTLQMTQFEQTLPIANGTGLQTAAVALDSTGQYAAVGYNGALGWGGTTYLRVVDINSCGNQMDADKYVTPTLACQVVDEYPTFSAQSNNINGVDGVSFTTDHSLLVDSINKDHTRTRYALTAAGTEARAVQYLAMGDSYISGEGAFSYRPGTDTGSNKCHQSVLSYPYILSGQFSSFGDVTCSGADINNIIGNDKHQQDNQIGVNDSSINQAQKDAAFAEHSPGILLQKTFLEQDNPEVITVSIGGNDIGFKQILEQCVGPFEGDITPDTNCYTSYEDRLQVVNTIDDQFDNLVDTYKTLKANDLQRKVYVVGYPQIMSTSTQSNCGANVHFSQTDREFASQLIDYLDSVIQQAAAKAGVAYVDTQHALDGHKLCEASGDGLAVNGLTAGGDNVLGIGNESYHPTALGHTLLADVVNAQTHNFTVAMPAADDNVQNPTADASLDILQAPTNQQEVEQAFPVQTNAPQILERGSSSTVDISQTSGYLAPGSAQTVLHSTPVNLQPVQVDANGEIHGAVTIPADTTPGFHTLHMYAQNVAGQPVDVQQVVYVAASASDYDGDGVPNAADSCPGVPNSGTDVDQDGVDDACDPSIGSAPAQPSSTSGTTSGSQPTTLAASSNGTAATSFVLAASPLQPAGQPPLYGQTDEIALVGNSPSTNSQSSAVQTVAKADSPSATKARAAKHSGTGLLFAAGMVILLVGLFFVLRKPRRN